MKNGRGVHVQSEFVKQNYSRPPTVQPLGLAPYQVLAVDMEARVLISIDPSNTFLVKLVQLPEVLLCLKVDHASDWENHPLVLVCVRFMCS